jgi:hypothetical protein
MSIRHCAAPPGLPPFLFFFCHLAKGENISVGDIFTLGMNTAGIWLAGFESKLN